VMQVRFLTLFATILGVFAKDWRDETTTKRGELKEVSQHALW